MSSPLGDPSKDSHAPTIELARYESPVVENCLARNRLSIWRYQEPDQGNNVTDLTIPACFSLRVACLFCSRDNQPLAANIAGRAGLIVPGILLFSLVCSEIIVQRIPS
jgi:hypothetical protein